MAIALKRTGGTASNINMVCYGPSGAGKTTLIRTLPDPVILSAEGGLLSLGGEDIPYIEIATMDDLTEAYTWASESKEAGSFKSIALDSISEVAEVVLAHEKSVAKDPRQAYGALQDQMATIIRSFRDLPKHVYMSAKAEKSQDEDGKIMWSPSMPGNKLSQQLPYYFDEVFALRVEKAEDGTTVRMIQTEGDGKWTAKDRSGKCDAWQEPDLGAIIKKIQGGAK